MPAPTVDAIIIGGGPAGLSAALMLGRARRSVIVIDAGEPRNRRATAMHAVLGHDGLDPAELLRRGRAEVARYGVEVRSARAIGASAGAEGVAVVLEDGSTVASRALVLASGIGDALPEVPGLAEHWGTRVLHCPYCHGWEVRERPLGVLATGPMSLHQAELVRQWSDDVVVFAAALGAALDDEARERLDARGVRIVEHPVIAVEAAGSGPDAGLAIVTADGSRHEVGAVFTAGAPIHDEALIAGLELRRSDALGGGIEVDPMGASSVPRVWAAGNAVAAFASIPIAMASGTMAGSAVNAALVQEDGARAVAAARIAEQTPADFWERRYASTDRSWSGRPNETLVVAATDLVPGTALELGSGEGADALWLAERGWRVMALDISPTAVERARELVGASDVVRSGSGSVEAIVADLAEPWPVDGRFDLVVASFLHSPVALDRQDLLRRAAEAVAPGGRLLVITHAEQPPWVSAAHRAVALPSLDDELAALALDETEWQVETLGVRARTAIGPDGAEHELRDGVLRLSRSADRSRAA